MTGAQSSNSSILHLTAISTTSRLGPSISLIRQRMEDRMLEFLFLGLGSLPRSGRPCWRY